MGPPATMVDRPDLTVRRLLGSPIEPFFDAMGVEARGPALWPFAGSFAIAIVTQGQGQIRNRHGELAVAGGDTFAVFAGAPDTTIEGALEMVVCTPPGGGHSMQSRLAGTQPAITDEGARSA